MTGNPLTRTFGQAGVKTTLPISRTDPTVQSELFNLNGLAHKVTFESEFLVAGSNQAMSQLPLYDRLDDNATEFTRRQMAVRTFGQSVGTFVPTRFDERFYALRSDLQSCVKRYRQHWPMRRDVGFTIEVRKQTVHLHGLARDSVTVAA